MARKVSWPVAVAIQVIGFVLIVLAAWLWIGAMAGWKKG